MTILYISKIETNKGWGAETFLEKALNKQGIKTLCIDYEQNKYRLSEAIRKIKGEAIDAVLLQRGTGYSIPLEVLKSINRPRILLFTELIQRNANQHYLLKSSLFDHIFVRSDQCLDLMIKQNWIAPPKVSLALSAFSKILHRPIEGIKKDIDVLFVGSLTARRTEIIEKLSARSGINIQVAKGFGADMVHLVNRAKIVLNIHGEDFLDTETRVYEVLACKGFLISEPLSSESPFVNKKHLVEAPFIEDMALQIQYYLKNHDQRQTIAEEGHVFVKNNYSYDDQAKLIKNRLVALVTSQVVEPALLREKHLSQAARKEKIQSATDKARLFLIKSYRFLKRKI